MTPAAPNRTHVHPVPKYEGYSPMCGRRLRLGTYCGHEGYHTNPRRCLSCRKGIHAPPAGGAWTACPPRTTAVGRALR